MAHVDAFARHEALHMSLFLCEAVGGQLLEHPAVASRAAWSDLAEQAHDALWRLYQAIGAEAAPAGIDPPVAPHPNADGAAAARPDVDPSG